MLSGRGRPWVMIVDSSATTGSPSPSAPATFSETTMLRAADVTGAPYRDHVGMAHERAAVREGSPPSICTIGDLILDVVVLPDRPLAPDGDTPATIRLGAGGQAANVAAWAAALGSSSRLICKRGTDAASELATARARAVRRRDLRPGGRRSWRSRRVGSRCSTAGGRWPPIAAWPRCFDPSELEPSWVQSCDVLHVSGYCLLREPMAQAAIEAARLARRVTVDLASAHDIEIAGAGRFAERLQALRPDLVFATEAERAAVPAFDATWVIKLGAQGARFPEGMYPARPVVPVDTTGAGDALAAGYLVGGPELAIETAARSVGAIGAMPYVGPDRALPRAPADPQPSD